MRPRIKSNRICSSHDYEESRKIHAKSLKRWHEENEKEVEIISASIVIKKKKFVSVFGKLVPVTEQELKIHETLVTWSILFIL